jgi:outer membrane protein assembly factor BamB
MSPLYRAFAAVLLVPLVAAAQPEKKAPEPPIVVTLTTDRKLQTRLDAARDYIDEKDWPKAILLLQSILDGRNDGMVLVKRDGAEHRSARAEAERMIGSLPAKGLEYYRLSYDAAAADLLKEAKSKNSPELAGLVVRQYVNTESGPAALELFASASVSAGHPALARFLREREDREAAKPADSPRLFAAARAFERLLEQPGRSAQWSQQLLLKAAIAFHAVGEHGKGVQMWQQFTAKTKNEGLRARDPGKTPESVRTEFVRPAAWPMFGGDPSRSAEATGGAPFLQPYWRQALYMDEAFSDDTRRRKGTAAAWVEDAQKILEERKLPAIPAFAPITSIGDVPGQGRQPLVIGRSHWGIHAMNISTGKEPWNVGCNWSLEQMFKEPRRAQALTQWKQQYDQIERTSVVLQNSVIGQLSSDGERVYFVDDLAVPPLVAPFLNLWKGGMQFPWGPEINEAIQHNVLHAAGLGDGKILWALGGHGAKRLANDPTGELHDSYFLGPPLPLGGKLYALTEKKQELRFVAIEPRRGTVERIVPLAKVRDSMLMDIGRRMHAAPIAYGGGILVCPTNAGAVIGVDVQSLGVVWAYVYRTAETNNPQPHVKVMLGKEGRLDRWQLDPPIKFTDWKASAPVIVDDKVVFAAPDSDAVECLNLRDGSRVWRVTKQPDDIYLAGVYGDKVLIVGKERCQGLNLADGKIAWRVDTGMPSGRGIAADNLYYLPLKVGAATKGPEVCVIDLTKGQVVTHVRSQNKEPPGNLLFFEDKLLSQTATHLLAYPQLKAKIEEINKRLQGNEKDPVALTERAQLLMDNGDLLRAVEDLRSVLASKPGEELRSRARGLLFVALTDLLDRDFAAGEKYLNEYKELCIVTPPAKASVRELQNAADEQLRRQLRLAALTAKGREQQGKLVDALRAYIDFAQLGDKNSLIVSPDDSAVRVAPEAWAKARIDAMLKRATPEKRKELEEELEKRWKDLDKGPAVEKP